MLIQLLLSEVAVTGERDVLDLLPLALHDPVKDRHAIRLCLSLRRNLDIEVTVLAEILEEVLSSLLNQFRGESVLLINRKQFMLRPGPQVRAFDLTVNDRTELNIERDVR